MEWPLLYLAIFLLSSSSHSLEYASNDRLSPGKSISLNETLVSDGGAFALGFFPIGNSPANLYLAIRYNNIAQKTIVWVANREKPINVSLATLTISSDSNLLIMGSKGSVIWSSNVKSTSSSKNSAPVAVLLNNGNLVLREGSDTILWQSFDHPTDTFLPGMKFKMSSKPHKSSRLISWKGPQDPSLGNFSCCARPNTSLQVFIWQGSEPYWRDSVWNGRLYSAKQVTNSNYVTYQTVIATADDEIYVTYSLSDGSSNTRIKLDHSGQLQIFGWDYSLNNWIIAEAEPFSTCDKYGHCGPFGYCDRTELVPTCKCMEGFEPRFQSDWNRGNFSGGCVRRTTLQCGSRDMFSILGSRKLPDQFLFLRNKTVEECKAECVANCSCNAYAYSNLSIGAGNISRCLVWMGELIDTEILGSGGENLYLRLVGSKLDEDDDDDQKLHVPADKNKLIIIIVATTCFSLFFLQLCLCILWKKKLQEKAKVEQSESLSLLGFGANVAYSSMSIDDRNSSADMSLLSLDAIAAATDNFSEGNKLGEGGFGQVYKGKLHNGQEVAIKRLSDSSRQGLEEFKNEVLLIARLQHMNLVRLLGFCSQGEEKMLIYEYMPNKSLDYILFDPTEGTTLDWSKRKRIIDGIAQGLLYLHKYSRLKVIHRDLKASNILLDAELNPKISDFGIARIFDGNQEQRKTKRVVGTYGYMPPEYAIWGHFSEKTDVFSYGVLLLEIISGKKISCFQGINGSLNLLQYAWELWEDGRALELVDPLLGNSYCKEELLRCIHVGLSCVQKNAPDRPTMSTVISQLGGSNVSLPSPNQPAFQACESQVSGDLDCRRSGGGSANDVTITMIEGR